MFVADVEHRAVASSLARRTVCPVSMDQDDDMVQYALVVHILLKKYFTKLSNEIYFSAFIIIAVLFSLLGVLFAVREGLLLLQENHSKLLPQVGLYYYSSHDQHMMV